MNEKATKLIRLMVEPGTPQGEQHGALAALRRLYAADPKCILNGSVAAPALADPILWREKLVPFGKYRGSTLGAIADEDQDYIVWLSGWNGLREPMATYVHLAYRAIISPVADARPDEEYRP